MLNEIDFK